MESKGKKTD